MIAWALSLLICTGPAWVTVGPACHWEQAPVAPFASNGECWDAARSFLHADKTVHYFKCRPVPAEAYNRIVP